MRNHTGTHLLHRALRNVVGERARQAGSLVTPDYLRFDFPFDRALTDDERRAIEDEVRRIIREDRPVSIAFMSMAEAIEGGADAFFDEKYGETVRTIRVQDYSFELCGGTHCRATGQIGGFVITGERSIGSGTATHRGRHGRRRGRPRPGAASTCWSGRPRRPAPSSTEAVPERIAALQDELREAKRRLKAGGGAGIARRRTSSSPKPPRSCPASGWSRYAGAVRLDGGPQGRGADGQHGARVRRRGPRARRRRAAAVRDRVAGPRRARRLGRGPRPAPRCPRSMAGVAAGPEMAQGKGSRRDGLPAALAAITCRPRSGGLMAFWRRIWQRDGQEALAACTALDVGTEFAKALVFDIDAAGHGTVRGVGRKRQGLSHMQSGTVADIAAVVDNCAVALQEAEEMAGFRPTQVVIGIAGELVKGFTTTHAQERKKPDQPITEGELQKLIDNVQRAGAARGGAGDHLGDRACRTSTSGSSTPRSPAPRSTATR